jgi:hypothetical protein
MEFSAMAAIPNGGNGKGKAVFTIAEIGVHSLLTIAGRMFSLVENLIPVVVVPVMIINVVIAVVIITVSGTYDDDNRFRVRGSQSEQS